MREFGNYRNGSMNLVPDDIDGLPSTHIYKHLASNPDTLLYEADIDQGRAFKAFRPCLLLYLNPYSLVYILSNGVGNVFTGWACDQACCWLRKEYSTRTWFRVFPNRIEVNYPTLRIPFGILGCGSWNADVINTHPFDRGAFGFRPVRCGVLSYLCCTWSVYGGTVARQRCQCNGSLWPRFFDCGGWWCDEWCCDICCCTYRYTGIADADETAVAAGLALQAYFEGRAITKDDMDKCIGYWKENVSEMSDPVGRKREVCCEPFSIPCCTCSKCYKYVCNLPRDPIFDEDDPECTDECKEVYRHHVELREKQIHDYTTFIGPVRKSTVCKAAGCKRVFGRHGLIFCTEGCCDGPNDSCGLKKQGEPAPPFRYRDIDDENDASVVLQKVLGDPPLNVTYRRWQWDEENQLEMAVTPAPDERQQKDD